VHGVRWCPGSDHQATDPSGIRAVRRYTGVTGLRAAPASPPDPKPTRAGRSRFPLLLADLDRASGWRDAVVGLKPAILRAVLISVGPPWEIRGGPQLVFGHLGPIAPELLVVVELVPGQRGLSQTLTRAVGRDGSAPILHCVNLRETDAVSEHAIWSRWLAAFAQDGSYPAIPH